MKKRKGKDFKHIALKLQKRLLAEGFIIQRYDAYSTNSIYLKLDYGLCNSIRISDHTGLSHLHYMFNLGKDIKTIYQEKAEFTRYYYPFNEIDKLVNHILQHRINKRHYYGDTYPAAMEQTRQANQTSRGFWSKAYLVTDTSADAELRRRFEAAFTVTAN